MTNRRFRFPVKALATLLSAACFLTFDIAAVSSVLAAEPAGPAKWQTWPTKPETTLPSGKTVGPGFAGEEAGTKTSAGISRGTWYWIAGGIAAAGIIALAAGGGGGGGSDGGTTPSPTCSQH